jgi:DNA-binding MarR family transcriptional regulator
MVASSTGVRLEETARDLFAVVTQLGLTALRGRRRSGDLKEVEFLTLAILNGHGTMIVGDIQRLLGVLPAQMSRIIRSLENRDRPLITCQINSRDKRKVDVCLTASGEKALLEYQANRTDRLVELLRDLPEQEQEDLNRLVDKLHGLLERGPGAH